MMYCYHLFWSPIEIRISLFRCKLDLIYFRFNAANLASKSVNLASSDAFGFSFSFAEVAVVSLFSTVPNVVAIVLSECVAGAASLDSAGAGSGPLAAACGSGSGSYRSEICDKKIQYPAVSRMS